MAAWGTRSWCGRTSAGAGAAMKAGAAGTLKRLLEARAARPEEPCALLLGSSAQARASVRHTLGVITDLADGAGGASPQDEEAGCCRIRADVVEGGAVIVDLPDMLRGAAEVTELATFLRGLRDAHGVLLACADQPPSDTDQAPVLRSGSLEAPLDTLPLLTEFYGSGGDLPFLLAVPALEAAEPHKRHVLRRLRGGSGGGPVIGRSHGPPAMEVVCIEGEGPAQRQQLLEQLRRLRPLPCEPLRGSSPLLAQYRAIRQQLDQRRPDRPERPDAQARAGSPHSQSSRSSHPVPRPQQQPEQQQPQQQQQQQQPQPLQQQPESPESPKDMGEENGLTGLTPPYRRQWTVMVFGKTGAGKSHLANLLVGHKAFDSGDSVASVTGTESVRRAASSDDSLMVLDTIGFGDTRLPPDVVVRSLRDTALEAPGGIDGLFFVLKKERVTSAEQETLGYVTQDLFGKECLPNLYMVVTHAGRLAKDVELREPWLKEQAAASVPFAAILDSLGPNPVQRIAFVENPDPNEAEDEEDRALARRRRQRAIADIRSLLERHQVQPYQHGIMHSAGEFHAVRLEEMRRELRGRVESEVRRELEKDRGVLEAERNQLRTEMETLKEREETLQNRFEEEWSRMRSEFENRARELARDDLEPLAQDIIDKTEKKAKGRRCVVM